MLLKILLVWFVLAVAVMLAWPSIARRMRDMNPEAYDDKTNLT